MKELVDKDALLKQIIDQVVSVYMQSMPGKAQIKAWIEVVRWNEIKRAIEDSTLSPAQLAEVMGGAMWVVEVLKGLYDRPSGFTLDDFKEIIRDLESQAPSSDAVIEFDADLGEDGALFVETEDGYWPIEDILMREHLEEKLKDAKTAKVHVLILVSKIPPTAEEGKKDE